MAVISYWAVGASALAFFLIGFVWYLQAVFGKTWMREAGMTEAMGEAAKKRMPYAIVGGLITAFITSYVLAHVLAAFGAADINGALTGAFWVWLGFIATSLLGSVLWEMKSFTYWAINAGYYLVALAVASVIIVLWK